MSITTAVSALRSTKLFSQLGEDKLNVLAFGAERLRFQDGDTLIEPGMVPPECHIILRGHVNVRAGSDLNGYRARSVGPGSAVGEMALLTNKPNTVLAVAETSGEALVVGRTLFERMLEDFPEIIVVLRDTLAEQIRSSISHMADLESALRHTPPTAQSARLPEHGQTASPSRAPRRRR